MNVGFSKKQRLTALLFAIPVVVFGGLSLLEGLRFVMMPLMFLSLASQQLYLYREGRKSTPDGKNPSGSYLFSSVFLGVAAVLIFGLGMLPK